MPSLDRSLTPVQKFTVEIEVDNWANIYGKLIILAMHGQTDELNERLGDYTKIRLMDLRRALTILQPIVEDCYRNQDFN